ncbi:helix-turn-helix domain-containing protein [Micromonospora sp. ALFpr18c]|uniref:helix-turn-helix domain-containing protein n=1 Tax=Micromonospora sp. ALFpr18c TaxID=1458665 RepID=UPI001788A23C|nr:helix-turn-helix transcriptional regulator [Micromonospora sp. ALFpr18c]
MEDQPRRPSEVLAEQVKVWRDRRKLSAQGLADRIKEIGGTLSRVAISKIENGDRGVSLDEWLQLAHALAVPPPLLFLDLQSGADIAVAPGVVLHPWLVWEWATGNEPPLVRSPRGGALVSRVEEFTGAQEAIDLYQTEARAGRAINQAQHDIRAAEYSGDDRTATGARAGFVEALRQLAGVLDGMVERGMTPPGKPREWIDAIRELRLSRYPDRLVIFEPEAADGER